jgi:phospholipid/cholesterol/gamma-HCH transport system permease protein
MEKRFSPAPAMSILQEIKNEVNAWVRGSEKYCTYHLSYLGNFALFSYQTFIWIGWRLPRREQIVHSLYTIGVLSLPVVMLTGVFIGMVLAVQTFAQFEKLKIESWLGGVISLSLVRELGPVLAATMLAGRVGSSIAAELGTMRVTEQIDALSSMGVNPIHYLVVPRFLACLFLIPALTIIADVTGVFGGAFYSISILNINSHHYWENASDFVNLFDVFIGMFKSVFFGGSIALISCHQGFHCREGAEGVGRAATQSFVYSFVAILLLDLLLGIIIDQVMLFFGISSGFLKG